MRQLIKKMLPEPLKRFLIAIKSKTIDSYQKKKLVKRMQVKHQELLVGLKGKEKIRVVFLAIHKSVWKVDTVFQRMLADPYFEPVILVCPYMPYGEERMLDDMEQAYSYFKDKGYPVKKSLRNDGSWVQLKDMQPDMVFFTNPYELTKREYYKDAFLNYLSCYIPYYYMATKHAGDECAQFNNLLFLLAWRMYWQHDYSYQLHKNLSVNLGVNGLAVGYPATENLLDDKSVAKVNTWKPQDSVVKKIIFSPHHTIDDSKNSLSCFLQFGEYIQALAVENRNKVQWSFKPHPILKSKLYLHIDWGKEKTDAYYHFWESQSYTQLDEGEYEDLFLQSDAIIHDCSSFIVEYAFIGKPCLYLVNENNLKGLLNDFGEGVMRIYEKAKTIEEIEDFVKSIVNENIEIDKNKSSYFDAYVDKFYNNKLPSERIIEDIKKSLGAI